MSKELFLPQLTSSINNTFIHPSRFDYNGRPIDINFTVIDGGLYLSSSDMEEIFGVSQDTMKFSIDDVYKEICKGSNKDDIFITSDFSIKRIKTPSVPKPTLYYPHSVFIKLAFKINTLNAKRIESHVISVMQELTTNDFVVNQRALETNPTLPEKIFGRIAHHFSPQRHDMRDMNNAISGLFFSCYGATNSDEQADYQIQSYFGRCCHNTAHISTVGMSALEIRARRADPNSPTFGQVNYRGKVAPYLSELNNATNYLFDDELVTRTCVVKNGVSRILTYIRKNGPLHYREALKMFTYHSMSDYLFPVSRDWRDCPETALTMVINAPDKSELRTEVKRALEIYMSKFYPNGVFAPYSQETIDEATQILVNEAIKNVEI